MRSLVVAQDFPWPPSSGSFLRLANVIRALADLGDVELFSTVLELRDVPCDLPADVGVVRSGIGVYPVADYSVANRVRWLLGDLPLELAAQQLRSPAREFVSWVRPHYDFVWFSKASTYVGFGRPRLGPTVVDLDDLEDRKLLARLRSGAFERGYGDGVTGWAHRRSAVAQATLNARRWGRLQRDISAHTEAVIVCSELDRSRAGFPNGVVVPNGYDAPPSPLGRTRTKAPPTVLFQGVLHYGPNADAVQWLVREIAPRLRQLVPGTRIRLVGAPDTPIRRLHDPPAVTVVGRVSDMGPELEAADLAVVPLRFGSGTRVKILEAFAHRIPVVSTTLGAEGLGLEAGRHLLVADSPEEFAAACARFLRDPGLCDRTVEEAYTQLVRHHQWEHGRSSVVDLAHRLSPIAHA